MAKHWSEPLDPPRHWDHFHPGGAHRRHSVPGARSYFVEVLGFTFDFCVAGAAPGVPGVYGTTHPRVVTATGVRAREGMVAGVARTTAGTDPEGSKRERVKAALRNALAAFAVEQR